MITNWTNFHCHSELRSESRTSFAIISTTHHWISRGQMINPPLPPFRKVGMTRSRGGMGGFESGFLGNRSPRPGWSEDGRPSSSPSLLCNWEQNKEELSGRDGCRGSRGAAGREKIKDGFEAFLQIRLDGVRSAFKFRLFLFRFFLSGRGRLFLPHLQLRFNLADEINKDPRANNN